MRALFACYALALAGLVTADTAAAADEADPAVTALKALFATPADAGRFASADFAARLPPATLTRYVTFYEKAIGEPVTIARDGDDYALTAARGSLQATIALDADGKISALRFHDEISAANADALRRVLQAGHLSIDWFAATPSRDVAVERAQKILDGIRSALGTFRHLDTRHGRYVAVYDRGETHAQISADNSGKIVYLSFEKP